MRQGSTQIETDRDKTYTEIEGEEGKIAGGRKESRGGREESKRGDKRGRRGEEREQEVGGNRAGEGRNDSRKEEREQEWETKEEGGRLEECDIREGEIERATERVKDREAHMCKQKETEIKHTHRNGDLDTQTDC